MSEKHFLKICWLMPLSAAAERMSFTGCPAKIATTNQLKTMKCLTAFRLKGVTTILTTMEIYRY